MTRRVRLVSTVTEKGAGRPGFYCRQGQWRDFISLPPRPGRIRGPNNLLCNGYRGLFSQDKQAGAWSWPLTSI